MVGPGEGREGGAEAGPGWGREADGDGDDGGDRDGDQCPAGPGGVLERVDSRGAGGVCPYGRCWK